jgi:hypothetical protein
MLRNLNRLLCNIINFIIYYIMVLRCSNFVSRAFLSTQFGINIISAQNLILNSSESPRKIKTFVQPFFLVIALYILLI